MGSPGTPIGPFGRFLQMEDDYRSNPAVSNSSLNTFIWSEWMYKLQFIDGIKSHRKSPAMTFGTAFHCMILESDQFAARFAIWDGASRRGKAWDEYKAHEPREIIDRDDYELMQKMAEEMAWNKEAMSLLDECDKEVVFRHTGLAYGGLTTQCRVDGISPFGDVIDLKTCDNIDEFKANISRYGYHRQALWYRTLASAVSGGLDHEFTFIAVEKKAPFRCELFRLDSAYYIQAHDEISDAMTRLAKCLETNVWKRNEPGIQYLSPRWLKDVA